MLIEHIVDSAKNLLGEDSTLLSQLVAARKRSENWMQIEIYKRLIRNFPKLQIELERLYPEIRERCDLWCLEADGSESWVEMKVCVTNYAAYYTTHSSPRPITNQIADIIRDTQKLKGLPEAFNRHIFLLTYPMIEDHDKHTAWRAHLSSMEASGVKPEKALVQAVVRRGKTAFVVGYQIAV
ncbi:MAG: hypothetical protein ACREEL_11515 [Stellaceae bacterium]